MRLFVYPLLVASSAALVAASSHAATRPRYGGTLRVEVQAKVGSLDFERAQSIAESDAASRICDLIFDRLVRLNQKGEAEPALAVSWEHDAPFAKWRFTLRPGVKWQDGAPLTPAEVAASLDRKGLAGAVGVVGGAIEFSLSHAWPDFPTALATNPSFFIRRQGEQPANSLPIGTGPFRVTDWNSGRSAELEANDDYWGGRPFIDKIEIQMGRSSKDQFLD